MFTGIIEETGVIRALSMSGHSGEIRIRANKVLEGTKINWMMLPVILPNNTDPSKELIEQCIAEGKCKKIRCSDGYYKSYCLYQIVRTEE